MNLPLFVQETLLTHPVVVAASSALGDGIDLINRFEHGCFALVETGFLPQLTGYKVDAGCGISLRDAGLARFFSPVRPDQLDDPVVRLQTASLTTELLARATLPGYFGFTPSAWVTDAGQPYDAIVLDEIAGISPTESEFAEDLSRAWFVLTGTPFVSHIVAVPDGASADEREAVTNLIHAGFEGDLSRTRAFAIEQGADPTLIDAVLADVASVLTGDERLAIPELFRRCGLNTGFGSVDWAT